MAVLERLRGGGGRTAKAMRALVAAASSVSMETSWKSFKLGDERWQQEAWRHYDICGELRFAANWIGGAVSRCRIYIAELDELQRPGAEVTDPEVALLAETVFGGPAAKAECLRLLGAHLYVPGESYIVAEAGERGKDDIWYVVSTSGVRKQASAIEVKRPRQHGGGWHALREGKDLLIRVWTPHPRDYDMADSSVRAALPILREIEQLTKHTFAQVDSRLAGAGILVLPEEIDFPAEGDEGTDATAFMKTLEKVMGTALADRSDPSSLVPIVVQVKGEYVDKIRHITLDTPLSREAMDIRDRAIRRLALALDLDPEILLGKGDTNHWSAWQLEESTIKVHVEPILTRICDALTTAYLRPALGALGKDPDSFTFWYDTSPLAIRPNRQRDGLAMYERDAISAAALRKAGAWSEDEAPSDEEMQRKLAHRLVLANPHLIYEPAIREALGVEWDLRTPPSAMPTRRSATAPLVGAEEGEDRALPQRPNEYPDSEQTTPQYAALLMGAHMAAHRSLEMAGKRLLTRQTRDKYHDTLPWELHTRIRVLDRDHSTRLLADTYNTLPDLAARTGVDERLLRDLMSAYCQELMVRGVPHRLDLLDTFLRRGLHAGCSSSCQYPLHPAPCTSQFHLPGRHDQKTHGRRRKGIRNTASTLVRRRRQLSASIDSGVASRERIGLSGVDRVRFNDGREGIVRRGFSPKEAASALVGEALDAPVAATVRRGGDLYQEVAPGISAWEFSNRVTSKIARGELTDPNEVLAQMRADSQALIDLVRSDAGKRAGVFDYLTGQSDRHMSNWLVSEDGKSFTLIDHELSFGKAISPFSEYWSTQHFTSEEAAEILERVRALEPGFRELGLEAEYAEMVRRAEYVRQNGRFDPDVIIKNKLNSEGKPI